LATPCTIASVSTASSPGTISELQAQKYLRDSGWNILATNIEICGIQTDIIARDQQRLLHVIEVKSQGSMERGFLSWKQRARLQRVVEVLSQKEPATLALLVVDGPKVWLFEGEDL
jgi:Holliday junction resolvase-like predicted endonuclease